MNELIHKLALQTAGSHYPNVGGQNLEKFAELVVQECIRYFNEDYTRDFDTLWREDLSRGIKQHFGIQE